MSIGTIVILVIAIIMLIFGIVFVRSIMCTGIQVTEDLGEGVKNEVKGLFNAGQFGVKCVGEGSQEIKIGSGGRRKIICIVKTEEETEYDLNVRNVESVKGASGSVLDRWILDEGWSGIVSPGGEGTEATVLLLDIPKDAPTTTLKITIDAVNGLTGTTRTHVSYIDVVPAGFFRTAMC